MLPSLWHSRKCHKLTAPTCGARLCSQVVRPILFLRSLTWPDEGAVACNYINLISALA